MLDDFGVVLLVCLLGVFGLFNTLRLVLILMVLF